MGILLVVAATTAATGSVNNNVITNRLLQIAEAQLTDNNGSNNNADVSIVSQRAYSDEYTFHIVGEVQNTGSESAEFVQIVASFYEGNGQFVGTSYTFTAPTTVSPGTKAPFDIQMLIDDKIAKESKSYQLTLSWTNEGGKEIVKQYKNADLRQGQEQEQQSSSFPSVGSGTNTLSQIPEATTSTATTDILFAAKALQFLTYCNNQFSQTPVGSMTIDTLVFCTMVYDWYYIGCNNAIIAPIIAAQCKDPVIIQQVNNYKTQIDIRIKEIIVPPLPPINDNQTNGNQTTGGDNTTKVPITMLSKGPDNETDFSIGDKGGGAGSDNGDNSSLLLTTPPDPCVENPSLPECTSATPLRSLLADPCVENPSLPECTHISAPTSPDENLDILSKQIPPPSNLDGDDDDKDDNAAANDGGGSGDDESGSNKKDAAPE